MSLFILLYLLIIIGIASLFILLFPRYIHSVFGRYLLLGLACYALWLIGYILAFTITFDTTVLLYFSRVLYALSLIASYSTTLFFFYFGNTKLKEVKEYKIQKYFIFFCIAIITLSVATPYFISEMAYDYIAQIHYEKFGAGFLLFEIGYLLNPLLTIGIIVWKMRQLNGISKIRYQYLSLGYSIFIVLYALFLIILPLFDIWMFQKEQILFFIPFLGSFFYASYRYRFSNMSIEIGQNIIFLLSLIISFLIVFFLHSYLSLIDSRLISFWGFNISGNSVNFFEFSFGIILFVLFYKYLSVYLISSSDVRLFEQHLQDIKNKLPYFHNIGSLNIFLKQQFKQKLNISETGIVLYENIKNQSKNELLTFFQKDRSRDIFLNDPVFIEENKNKFDIEKIKKELDKNIGIYFPIFSIDGDVLGFLALGRKPFGDFYATQDIILLRTLTLSLQSHLKYISIYEKIQDLTITLDKKVDEKTIQYNNLISQQKEFIRYMGHEIKNPITNTIFLCDALRDGLASGLKNTKLEEDAAILYDELIKVSKLVSNIFSIEQFDLSKVQLVRQQTDIAQFIREEVSRIESVYSNVAFEMDMQHVEKISIDRVQFRQVVINLITNAIKFSPSKGGKIYVSVKKSGKHIQITIEDNGPGFQDFDADQIFEKYTTGSGNAIGLGMGLYLCKKIVELHQGSIIASNSEKLGGARFSIIF